MNINSLFSDREDRWHIYMQSALRYGYTRAYIYAIRVQRVNSTIQKYTASILGTTEIFNVKTIDIKRAVGPHQFLSCGGMRNNEFIWSGLM